MSWKFHLELAHDFWKKRVKPGSTVVDATAGNGYDAALLASLALTPDSGRLIVIDTQPQAIAKTKEKLSQETLPQERIIYHTMCHSRLGEVIEPNSCMLIVFNLGYLPGADKSFTTHTETTLRAILSALECIQDDGAISITCYPGHPEGKIESAEVVAFCKGLSSGRYQVTSHCMLNRDEHPHLLLIQKKGTLPHAAS